MKSCTAALSAGPTVMQPSQQLMYLDALVSDCRESANINPVHTPRSFNMLLSKYAIFSRCFGVTCTFKNQEILAATRADLLTWFCIWNIYHRCVVLSLVTISSIQFTCMCSVCLSVSSLQLFDWRPRIYPPINAHRLAIQIITPRFRGKLLFDGRRPWSRNASRSYGHVKSSLLYNTWCLDFVAQCVQIALQTLDAWLDQHHLFGVSVRDGFVCVLAIMIAERRTGNAKHSAQYRADVRPIFDSVCVDFLLFVWCLNGGREMREEVAFALILVVECFEFFAFALIGL